VQRRRFLPQQEQLRLIGIGHNNPPVEPPPALLHTRQQASRMLNCSVMTLIRLEKARVLTPIKLNKPTGQTYYGHDQLLALASRGGTDAR
jgi:hypothetical protein